MVGKEEEEEGEELSSFADCNTLTQHHNNNISTKEVKGKELFSQYKAMMISAPDYESSQ